MHISFFLSEFGQVSTEENDFFFQTLRRSCDSLLSRRPSDPEGQNLDPFLLAVEALVESHFSRVHGDARLSKESMIVYGQALRRMSIELERTNFASIQELAHEQWENLVFCCLTLALCEVRSRKSECCDPEADEESKAQYEFWLDQLAAPYQRSRKSG